jgi:hypothetical protein
LRVLEEGVDEIADVLRVEDFDGGLVGDHEGCMGGEVLEKVDSLRTI